MSEKPTKITSTDFLDPHSADAKLTQQLLEHLPASRKQRRLKNKSALLYIRFFQECRQQIKNWLSSGFIFKDPEVMRHPERWADAEKFHLSKEDGGIKGGGFFKPFKSHGDVSETPRKALLQGALLRCKSVPLELHLEQLAPYQTKEERVENTAFLPKDKVEVLEDYRRRIEVFSRDFSKRNPSVCVLKEFRPHINESGSGNPNRDFRGSLSMTVWFLTARKTFFQVKMEWRASNNQVRYTFTEYDSQHLIGRFCDKYYASLGKQLDIQKNIAEKIDRLFVKGEDPEGNPDTRNVGDEGFRLRRIEESEDYWDKALKDWRQWPKIIQVRPEIGGLGLLNWFQL